MLTRLLEEIIKEKHVRDALKSALERNEDKTLVVTGYPGIGKSTTIACGIAALLYRGPGSVTLCLQHERHHAIRHEAYIRSSAFAGGCLSNGSITHPDGDTKLPIIAYTTYSEMLKNFINPERWKELRMFNCLIFDEAHRQSIDQEMVTAYVSATSNARVVMMTAYYEAPGFLAGCRVPVEQRLDLNAIYPDFQMPSLTASWYQPQEGTRYKSWALQTVVAVLKKDQKAKILVFLQDRAAEEWFQQALHRYPTLTGAEQPRCVRMESLVKPDAMSLPEGRSVILGVADFGSRVPLQGVTCVVTDSSRVLNALDLTIAKDILKKFQLRKTELAFLAAHATAPGSTIHIPMDAPTGPGLHPGITRDTVHGSRACEYYLKAICLFPARDILDANCFPLRYSYTRAQVQWAVRQLSVLGLISTTSGPDRIPRARVTPKGLSAVQHMSGAQDSLLSTVYGLWFKDSRAVRNSAAAAAAAAAASFLSLLPLAPVQLYPRSGKVNAQEKEEIVRVLGQAVLPRPLDGIPWVLSGDILAYCFYRLCLVADPQIHARIPRWCTAYDANASGNDEMAGFDIVHRLTARDAAQMKPSVIMEGPHGENIVTDIWSALVSAFVFNIARVDHAAPDTKPWVAMDCCSGRDVYIDERCPIDAPGLVARAKELGWSGIHVLYKHIMLVEDGRYVISGLTYIPQTIIAKFLTDRSCGPYDLASLIGSTFR
ncbi:hypothetical protein SLS62_006095 [Diatrype stigma]|uniref:Helicase ATP-binding domain-containing protein n=1 Tax=Diatrype stigma TaxID=117547 RepID=A0AAN9YRK3_9PEZI